MGRSLFKLIRSCPYAGCSARARGGESFGSARAPSHLDLRFSETHWRPSRVQRLQEEVHGVWDE
eukprot:scaffold237769_cov30-Tisochrysis_lutea.AAC.1